MKIHSMMALAAVAAILGSTAVAAQESTGKPFDVTLNGESEVPGPGDQDGKGTATIRINPGQQQLCYTLTVTDIQAATAAHIHEAPVGEAGGVVVNLQFSGTSNETCIEVSRDLARDIIRNPADYYVNVHNAEFPDGAVRGQLSR